MVAFKFSAARAFMANIESREFRCSVGWVSGYLARLARHVDMFGFGLVVNGSRYAGQLIAARLCLSFAACVGQGSILIRAPSRCSGMIGNFDGLSPGVVSMGEQCQMWRLGISSEEPPFSRVDRRVRLLLLRLL